MRKPPVCKGCPAEHDPCLVRGDGDNPAHIVVIGANPSGFSIGKNQAFYGNLGRLFAKFLDQVRRRGGKKFADLRVYTTYAALVGAYKPTASHVQHCQPNLQRELSLVQGVDGREPVLVPLGPLALSAVGVKAKKITDVVGRRMSTRITTPIGVRKFEVVPLLSMEHVSARPGTANVVLAGLLKAVKLGLGDEGTSSASLDEVTKGYVFPESIEELRELIDHIIGYYDEDGKAGPENWPIALDTETNTLEPYSHPSPRTLMVSVAWDTGKATTILLSHDETPYDRDAAWHEVQRLLQCPKPKVLHNWKFDQKFVEVVNAIPVNRVAWDTMLGEHYLDEDKKGLYSLKQLTPIYAPAYTGYDDALQQILRGDVDGTLRLKNDDIVTLARPEDRDADKWDKLVDAVKLRNRLKKKPAAKRTKDEKSNFTQAGKDIKALREELRIKLPTASKDGLDEGFAAVPLETILRYAAVDADVTRIIFVSQTNRLNRTNLWEEGLSVMKNLYLPGSRVLSDMEYHGFKIDRDRLGTLWNEVEERMNQAKEEVALRFDPNLNLNAAGQVAEAMVRLGFEALPGVEQGTTGKDSLKQYVEYYDPADPRHIFADMVLQYRECHKTLNSFLKPIREFSAADGRVHAGFHLNGTSTGRLSSSNPNMQNVPKITCRKTRKNPDTGEDDVVFPGFNIKNLFVPSKPGNVIVNCDIAGAELRVYTAYSHDQLMIDALNKGMDVHSMVTSKVYKIPYDVVKGTKDSDPDIATKRTNCKRTVFGTFYGAGPYKIAEQINSTFEEAKELQTYLFTEFPALPQYINSVTEQVQMKQMVKTYFGRCRRFRMAHMTDKHFQDAKREAVNFLIQSTSSDLVLSQLCEVSDNLAELGGQMLITVHDSLVFELPEENVSKLFDFLDYWIVDRVKEKFSWLPVEFAYDVEVGPAYGSVKEIKRKKKADAAAS